LLICHRQLNVADLVELRGLSSTPFGSFSIPHPYYSFASVGYHAV